MMVVSFGIRMVQWFVNRIMNNILLTQRLKQAIELTKKISSLLPSEHKPDVCAVGLFFNTTTKEFVFCPSASKWSFVCYRSEDEVFLTYDLVTILWVFDTVLIRPNSTVLTKLRPSNDSKAVFVSQLCKDYLKTLKDK